MGIVDAGRLIQVLLNLLANAHEAMNASKLSNQIKIQMSKERDSDNAWVRIDVSDNGPGIPAHLLSRLFEPFFTTKDEGTGFGLYLAHEIIREQGGKIEVNNVNGGGACFSIRLPMATEAAILSDDR